MKLRQLLNILTDCWDNQVSGGEALGWVEKSSHFPASIVAHSDSGEKNPALKIREVSYYSSSPLVTAARSRDGGAVLAGFFLFSCSSPLPGLAHPSRSRGYFEPHLFHLSQTLSCTPPHELLPVPGPARNSAWHVAGPQSGSGRGDQLFQPTLLFLFNSLYLCSVPDLHTRSALELLVVPGECVWVCTHSPTYQASSSWGLACNSSFLSVLWCSRCSDHLVIGLCLPPLPPQTVRNSHAFLASLQW